MGEAVKRSMIPPVVDKQGVIISPPVFVRGEGTASVFLHRAAPGQYDEIEWGDLHPIQQEAWEACDAQKPGREMPVRHGGRT